MTSLIKYGLLVGLSIVMGITVGMVWHSKVLENEQAQIAYFSHVLKNQNFTTVVTIDSTAFEVSDGAVHVGSSSPSNTLKLEALRVAYAQLLAERSPYVAIPGVDPDMLDTAVQGLSETQKSLAKIQNKQSDADAVQYLYPITFLHAMAATERARLALIESGSDSNEKRYELLQLEAIAAYEKDLRNFTNTFERMIPQNVRQYADASSVISRENIVRSLQSLHDGVRLTEMRIQKRNRCIHGEYRSCTLGDLVPFTPTVTATAVLSRDKLNLSQEIFALHVPTMEADPAPIELSHSSCANVIANTTLFKISSYPSEPLTSFTRPYLINDIRFMRQDAATSTPFNSYFYDHGVTYILYSPFSHYACFTLADDYAAIYATRNIAHTAQTYPLSRYTNGTNTQLLQSIEAKLRTSKQIKETDAMTYLVGLRTIMQATSTPKAARNTIESLLLQVADKSSGFDNFVYSIVWIENSNVKIATEDKVPVALDARYLFLVRSGYLGLFMSNNASVVGQQKPFFPLDSTPPSEQPYVLFSQLATSTGAHDKALRDLHSFTLLHIDQIVP